MCKEPGCEMKMRARGMCIKHYSAWRVINRPETIYNKVEMRGSTWVKEDYDDFWEFVKEELKIVQ